MQQNHPEWVADSVGEMSRLANLIAPARLGSSFRWLVASSWSTNLSDGIALAAAPLLVVSQTTNPVLVASATVAQRLPWFLFGLHAGVLADRLNRRRLLVVVNTARALAAGVIVAALVTGAMSIWLLLGLLFVMGLAETIADTTSRTMLPIVVSAEDLGVGNARIRFGMVTLNRMAGPAIGAALFGVGTFIPFVAQIVLLVFGVLLITRVAITPISTGEPSTVRQDIVDGITWAWRNPPVRTLIATIGLFNITFGATFGILVLYVTEHLRMGPNGFGLITSVSAVGAVVGVIVYPRADAKIGAATIMRIGLIVETLTHLVLAATQSAVIALITLFVFGIHEGMWGTTSSTVQMKLVPRELQGRVSSVNTMVLQSSLLVGTALGGVIAARWGVTGPFWFGFFGSVPMLFVLWRRLGAIAAQPTVLTDDSDTTN